VIDVIIIKRIYDAPSRGDGKRILVDRLWPRGVKKDEARIDAWMKDVAPSGDLRKWFGHDPEKWGEFKRRFFAELKNKKDLVDQLAGMARKGRVTLLFGSKEERFNNAVALKEYLEARRKNASSNKTA
jgi:uncharacterized protein YeaO (DUF488 family)